MADEEKSLSLIESLRAYQETQETLNDVVSSASKALGPDWMSLLPDALNQAPMDEQERSLLRDKANHAIHYYGALAAWEEAYQYINAPHSVDRMMILERIPTLEYWLALFGDEGVSVLNQVKSLVHVESETPVEDEKTDDDVEPESEKEEDQPVTPEASVPENVALEEENTVVEEVPSLEDEPIVDIYAHKNEIQEPVPIPVTDSNDDGEINEKDISDDQLKQMEGQVFENPTTDEEPLPKTEPPVEPETHEELTVETPEPVAVETLPKEKVEEAVITDEIPVETPIETVDEVSVPDETPVVEEKKEEVPETVTDSAETVVVEEVPSDDVIVDKEDTTSLDVPASDTVSDDTAPVVEQPEMPEWAEVQEDVPVRTELVSKDEPLFQENLPEPTEDVSVSDKEEVAQDVPETDKEEATSDVSAVDEEEVTPDIPKAKEKETNDAAEEPVTFTKAPSIPSKSPDANFDENILEILSQEQPKNLDDDPNTHIPLTRSWEMTNLLNKKSLYENGVNWVSAFCVRHDNANKEEYPYYGMIVDVMVDLKDTIQSVLDNQLLDEIIDQEYEGGREALERFKESIEVELAGLPDDLKPENRAQSQPDAKEILGDLDTSNDKVVVEAAPDGFELMDDPFETSAEQIISDFEKAEAASRADLNDLNVLSQNQKTDKAKDKKNEKK